MQRRGKGCSTRWRGKSRHTRFRGVTRLSCLTSEQTQLPVIKVASLLANLDFYQKQFPRQPQYGEVLFTANKKKVWCCNEEAKVVQRDDEVRVGTHDSEV
ncbi:hypothetical protein KIN20_009537 [Parelaphostrongylus tenuis]|uniref:Uncharacterized protein n=1 Tax=Parelaphostrongylus tenuis TaxID=148309 RepID=A0AAD5MBA4_PARTN|nr:hypothetical protein KIN20_009537 [Parelaphostrongylus tenuis]